MLIGKLLALLGMHCTVAILLLQSSERFGVGVGVGVGLSSLKANFAMGIKSTHNGSGSKPEVAASAISM
jgi:hypothetical protein